jgi:hypothetical protein
MPSNPFDAKGLLAASIQDDNPVIFLEQKLLFFDEPTPVRWTAAAEARLANIPEFVRPMARTGIEKFAQERGANEVDETILDAARDFFGM